MRLYIIAVSSATVSLFPLIYKNEEAITKMLLLILYVGITLRLYKQTSKIIYQLEFNSIEKTYLIVLVLVSVYITFLHDIILKSSYEFLPLMVNSVYCSLGIIYTWLHIYRQILIY